MTLPFAAIRHDYKRAGGRHQLITDDSREYQHRSSPEGIFAFTQGTVHEDRGVLFCFCFCFFNILFKTSSYVESFALAFDFFKFIYFLKICLIYLLRVLFILTGWDKVKRIFQLFFFFLVRLLASFSGSRQINRNHSFDCACSNKEERAELAHC